MQILMLDLLFSVYCLFSPLVLVVVVVPYSLVIGKENDGCIDMLLSSINKHIVMLKN